MSDKSKTVVPFARPITATTQRSEKGQFVKGAPKPAKAGRPRGKRNRATVRLKECILEAAELSGSDGKGKGGATGYLVWLSRAEPSVYGRMLEKILPMQLNLRDETKVALTVEEAIQKLRDRNLPIPSSLLEMRTPIIEPKDDTDLAELDDLSTTLIDVEDE